MAEQFDIVVIGGGPAGSVSALYARRAGLSVCVVEKSQFPRETLCGEFLSHEVVEVLDDLGLRSEFLALEPNPIKHVVLCSGSRTPLRAPLGFTAYGLSRSRFDAFLLFAAQRAGATVAQPCEVSRVTGEPGDFSVACTSHRGPVTLRALRIVAAHGKVSLPDPDRQGAHDRGRMRFAAAKFHLPASSLHGAAVDEIVLALGKNIYCGINHVGEGVATICCLDHRTAHAPSMRERVLQLASANPAFGRMLTEEALSALRSATIFGAGNISFGIRDVTKDGIISIGDAAGVIAPLAGDGIAMALQGAHLLGDLLKMEFAGIRGGSDFAEEYQRRWKSLFVGRMRVALLSQRLALSPAFARMAHMALSVSPGLLSTLIFATRSDLRSHDMRDSGPERIAI